MPGAGDLTVADVLAGRHKKLSLKEFLSLARQMAKCLAKFHSSGWVHGDVGPASFVLPYATRQPDGSVDLADIQVTLAESPLSTRIDAPTPATELAGTLAYVAPERTGRMQVPFDRRADLYSLGATFYEMLTGAPPFPTADPARAVHGHLAIVPVAPSATDPAMPRWLSDLVMKLLEKMPERRYQTADAVAQDLDEAERRLRDIGSVGELELGRTDRGQNLGRPRALYGRDPEVAALRAALSRSREGAHELVLVAGPGGIGKSSLVEHALSEHHWVASSKFEGLGESSPYAVLSEALRGLLARLVDARDDIRVGAAARARLALGTDGRALLPLIPDLERFTGRLPVLPAVEFADGDPRTRVALRALIQSLSARETPLTLFLDDLQWADAATIDLLGSLVTGDDVSHLLVVGAFRPDEVEESHPLSRLVSGMRAAGSKVTRLDIGPLSPAALAALCADVLYADAATVMPLASVVAKKATGNPLFVERFLRQLQREDLLRVDVVQRKLTYRIEHISAMDVSEDAVGLMLRAIRSLPTPIRNALAMAACFRGTIVATDLAPLIHEPAEQVEAFLVTAEAEGFLATDRQVPAGQVRGYRFVHDRVRDAAYTLLDDTSRARAHLSIGRRLLSAIEDPQTDPRLFDVVDHVGRAEPLLREPAERMRVVELSRIAADRAKASSGFGLAYGYLRRAIDFLPGDASRTHHALWIELVHAAITSGFLAGEVDAADGMASEIELLLDDPLDKAETLRLRVEGLTAADRMTEAIQCAEKAALILGQSLPRRDDDEGVRRDLVQIGSRLSQLAPDALLRAAPLTDARLQSKMRVLSAANGATWLQGEATLFAAAQARMVQITLDRGVSSESGGALVRFGAMYADAIGDPSRGYEISARGLDLALTFDDVRTQCRARFGMAFHISHFRSPLRQCVEEFRSIVKLGAECGEFVYAGHASFRGIAAALTMGLELPTVLVELDRASAFANRLELRSILTDLSFLGQVVHAMQGRIESTEPVDLTDPKVSRPRTELLARKHVWELAVGYLFRRTEQASYHAHEAEPLLRTMPSTLPVTVYVFYDALRRAAAIDHERQGDPAEVRMIESHASRLDLWATSCPENFGHKASLVRAELSRVHGRDEEALEGYVQAAAAAQIQGALPDAGTAHELAARLHLKRGNAQKARESIRAAMRYFARWGSLGKVDALADEFGQLEGGPPVYTFEELRDEHPLSSAYLDLSTLMKVAENLCSELVLARLFEKLVKLGLEIASAQHAVLVLGEAGGHEVRARGSAFEQVVLLRTPIDEATEIPRSLIRAVLSSSSPVLVNDAQNDADYGADEYIRRAEVRSVLAIPIGRKGETLGALYLESRLATAAFAESRVRLLLLLSNLIAVSLENCLFFERLTAEVDNRQRAEKRVRFLAEAGIALAETTDVEAVPRIVAQIAVPFLADWATVDVVTEDGSLLRVASQHFDPRNQDLLKELAERYPPKAGSGAPAAVALRTGEPVILEEITDSALRKTQEDAHHGDLIRRLGSRSAIAVPLLARGRKVGAFTLHAGGARPRFGREDVIVAQELARRAALSLDNARLESEVLQSQKLEAIGRLSAGVAHDFNNFLSVILSGADLLSRDLTVGRSGVEYVAQITEAAKRAAELTQQLLAVGRKKALKPRVLSINDFLATSSDMIRKLIHEPVGVIFEPDPKAGNIEVDPAQLTQVVLNLVANARDAMARGGTVTIQTGEIHLGEAADQRGRQGKETPCVFLAVSDTGIGMDPKTQARIFEPFFTTKPEGKGTGIGLATVLGLVNQSRGRILVKSRLGEGSTFTVCFPKVE